MLAIEPILLFSPLVSLSRLQTSTEYIGLHASGNKAVYKIDLYASSRHNAGGQSHCLVHACATGTFLTTAFTHNPIDPQAAAHFCFFDGVTSYA